VVALTTVKKIVDAGRNRNIFYLSSKNR